MNENENQPRYSFAQIAKVVGVDVQTLERWRRTRAVWWHPKGYTLEEVRVIIGMHPLLEQEAIENCRSAKAKALWQLLKS